MRMRLHAAQHEAAALEAGDDLADEAAGHAVGLDHDERALQRGTSWDPGGRRRGGGWRREAAAGRALRARS